MDHNHNPSEQTEPEADVQGRRELVRKLGKFAAYAAPFTVLALKGNAGTGAGSGGGGFGQSTKGQARKR